MAKKRTDKEKCPKFHDLFKPTLKALYDLGGSGSNEEIFNITKVKDYFIQQMRELVEEEEEMQPGKFFSLPLEDEEDKNVEAQLESNPFEFNVPKNMENMMVVKILLIIS